MQLLQSIEINLNLQATYMVGNYGTRTLISTAIASNQTDNQQRQEHGQNDVENSENESTSAVSLCSRIIIRRFGIHTLYNYNMNVGQ